MRYLILLVVLTGALCLSPEQCEQVTGDESQYICRLDRPLESANITLTAKRNDYVKLLCEGPNITCADIPPVDLASGLPLKSLGVQYCPPSLLSCVNEQISASTIEIVTLRKLSGSLTRAQLAALGDVRVLMMLDAEAETSPPVAAVSAYPSLRRLTVRGGNFQLYPRVFEDAPPLKYLELGQDHIESIPAGSFLGLGTLNELNLWGNPLENVTAGAFGGLESLEKLTLSSNGISSIEPSAFSDVPKLGSLYMMANRLKDMPNGLLQGLDKLENITILMNKVPLSLDSQAFSQLPSLRNILIKYTQIRHLPAGLFNGSSGILTIQCNYANIEMMDADVFLRLFELKKLDLSNNKLQELPLGIFKGLKKLRYLNLNRNFIEALPDGLFDGASSLKEIYMDFNKISTISPSSFGGARTLQTLSLASNQLTLDPHPNSYLFVDNNLSPFNTLLDLVKLDLKHNKINTIFYDWQSVLLKLEYLDLSYNDFKVIEFDHDAINFLNGKLTVDLRNNKIPTVIFDKPLTAMNSSQNSVTFLLDQNPISCDCSAYGLRIRLDGTRYAHNEPKFVLDNARCSSPPELQGELFSQLPPKELVCDLPEFCPSSCSNCIASVATDELIFDCTDLPKLPDTKSPNVSYYFIKEPTITLSLQHQPESLKSLNIHTLNLTDAGIDEIYFSPSKSLKVLDLRRNYLTTIPSEFLETNLTLYLSDNPLQCECWDSENIAALQKYKYIADFAQMTCANGDKVALIDATALCNTWKASIAAIGTFVSLAVCVLIAGIIFYRYSNEILVYMNTRGICKCCIKEVFQDKDKEYDVFISFAHQDLNIIQDKLLPMLENDLNQKVCVHYRDWLVGDMIPTQILRSVENSRRTVILLSKHFLESIWANLEFSAAHNLALQDGKSRVILILLDESDAKHPKLSPELRAYISTNTYLLWDDPKFSEKLRKVLPRRKHTFTWVDALKQRNVVVGEKEGIVGLDVQLNSDGKLVNVAKKIVGDGKSLPHHYV